MEITKQSQTIGNNSTSVQAGRDVNYYGLSFADVREIALDVFKTNFYELGDEASKVARERAEEITNAYLKKLEEVSPASLNNTRDPDLRYSIYEAQKSFARLGNKELSELLVEVLVQRTIEQNQEFKKLVLNEALTIIPKLTKKQIDILSLIFIFRYVNFTGNVPFEEYYSFLSPFLNNIPDKDVLYHHLQYAGCLSISVGSIHYTKIMTNKFPYLFKEKEKEQEVLKQLTDSYPELQYLFNKWQETRLCHTTLTSVGIAIAYSNLKTIIDVPWDINIWISE